jgi:hypothetical protein
LVLEAYMSDHDLDVAGILSKIKQEVREQYRETSLEPGISRAEAIDKARATSWVDPHQPIAWPHWPKGVLPKVKAALQKVTRRLLRWYIDPIVAEQNRFNDAVVTALAALARENAQLRTELGTLDRPERETTERLGNRERGIE